jgi:hypothetical protein
MSSAVEAVTRASCRLCSKVRRGLDLLEARHGADRIPG